MIKRINVFFVIGFIFLFAAVGLCGYNLYSDYKASEISENILKEIEFNNEEINSDAIIDPDMPMPSITMDGYSYVGVLEIPSLSLKLPVISSWSYDGLLRAPCVYCGSAYKDNMIIAAHNYSGHFGRLKNLSPGDAVIFTDIYGNEFDYSVSETEILRPNEIKEMTQSDFDLTLFTCTIGGRTRITVRCDRTE